MNVLHAVLARLFFPKAGKAHSKNDPKVEAIQRDDGARFAARFARPEDAGKAFDEIFAVWTGEPTKAEGMS
jgi:hypothetical protein